MPRAAQEGLRPGIPLLEQSELVKKELTGYSNPWLNPDQIPIHPTLVNESQVIFTPEFAAEVMDRLSDAVIKDDGVLGERFGGKGALALIDGGILYKGSRTDLRQRIRIHTNPGLFWVEVTPNVNAANVRIDRRRGIHPTLLSGSHYPMPLEKQMEYRLDQDQPYMYTWTRNNIADLGLVESLASRNVAILVNNLGLQKVGAV